MPWTPGDAKRHTKKASTPAKQEAWSKTADAVLDKSGDEGKAIRIANAHVAGTIKHKKKAHKKKHAHKRPTEHDRFIGARRMGPQIPPISGAAT